VLFVGADAVAVGLAAFRSRGRLNSVVLDDLNPVVGVEGDDCVAEYHVLDAAGEEPHDCDERRRCAGMV
jgi:hypothetical protein